MTATPLVQEHTFRQRPVWFAIALSAALVAAIALTLDLEWLRALDERILLSMRNPLDRADPLGPVWVEEAMRDVTALGSLVVIATAVTIMLTVHLLAGRPREALYLAVALGIGFGLTFLVKAQFARPRPDLVAHSARVLTHSFPSGHAATAALCYATLGALVAERLPRRRFQILTIVWAVVVVVAVGASRVYLGVHWPTDVLAGWALGGAWALVIALGEDVLRRRGWLEPVTA